MREVGPRLPEPGVCTAETLARLPARKFEVTIEMGCHTIVPVHARPHYVKAIRVAAPSAVAHVARAPPKLKRPRVERSA